MVGRWLGGGPAVLEVVEMEEIVVKGAGGQVRRWRQLLEGRKCGWQVVVRDWQLGVSRGG